MAAKKSSAAKTPSKTAKKAAGRSKANRKTAAPKKRPAASRKTKKAGDEEVTIDRRRKSRRSEEAVDSPAKPKPAPKLERRAKVQRRRQIDPTTCERDYSEAEVEFMNALDVYKRTSGRMFPTCSEVLEVIRGLGYVQLTPAEQKLLGRDAESEAAEAAAIAAAESADDEAEELVAAELDD